MDRTNRVVVGLAEEPDVLVQDFSYRHSTWAVLSPITLKLIRYDDQWKPWPELAERIPSPADGSWVRHPDGSTTVEYRLRAGLRWHDGRPVTADDALATFALLRSLPVDYPHREIIDAIDSMVVTGADRLSLTVHWGSTKPHATFEEWGTVLPTHLLQAETLHDPSTWAQHPLLLHPVSHGPFRVAEWIPGEHLRLVRHAAHPRGVPRINEIVFRFFTDPADLRAAVIDGQVDLTELSGFSPEDAATLTRAGEHIRIAQTPSALWEHIDFNLADRHLSDLRVRQAIAHAVDRTAIADALYQGRCEIAHSWLPSRHPAYNTRVRRYPHDPRAARDLLSTAGYLPDREGILRDRYGDPLSFHLLTTRPSKTGRWSASRLRGRTAELIAGQLRQVGIDLRVEEVPTDQAFRRFRSRQFPHMAMFAWSIGLEANGYLMWHSSQIPDRPQSYGINLPGWRSATNDKILEEIISEGDQDAREALMREQQIEWAQQLPALPLFFLPQINAYHRGLRNVRYVGAFGTYVTWNCWEWAWEADTT